MGALNAAIWLHLMGTLDATIWLAGWNIVPHIFVLSFNISRLLVHFYYVKSREKSNEPIVETLDSTGRKTTAI